MDQFQPQDVEDFSVKIDFLKRTFINVDFIGQSIILVGKYLMNTYSKQVSPPNMKIGLALRTRPTQNQTAFIKKNWIWD